MGGAITLLLAFRSPSPQPVQPLLVAAPLQLRARPRTLWGRKVHWPQGRWAGRTRRTAGYRPGMGRGVRRVSERLQTVSSAAYSRTSQPTTLPSSSSHITQCRCGQSAPAGSHNQYGRELRPAQQILTAPTAKRAAGGAENATTKRGTTSKASRTHSAGPTCTQGRAGATSSEPKMQVPARQVPSTAQAIRYSSGLAQRSAQRCAQRAQQPEHSARKRGAGCSPVTPSVRPPPTSEPASTTVCTPVARCAARLAAPETGATPFLPSLAGGRRRRRPP